jgi:hypothetical protein
LTPKGRRLLAALALYAAMVCLMPLRTTAAHRAAAPLAPQRPLQVTGAMWPAGLIPPPGDGRPLIAVVAVDVDADGDLDVVGNDGSLNLIVWSNDSTGRLTRQTPKRSTPSGWRPVGQTVDDQPLTPNVLAASGGSPLCVTAATPSFLPAPSRSAVAAASSGPQRRFAAARTPRGPPPSLLSL